MTRNRHMMTTYRIYMGANGYYIAKENSDGFHRQPADNGARLGFDREAAEEELRRQDMTRTIDLAIACADEAYAISGRSTDQDGQLLAPQVPLRGDYDALESALGREPTDAEMDAFARAYADAMIEVAR